MRLAAIADVHGNLVALEAVLADLRARSPDLLVNLGDCVTSPLWPRETLDLLDALALPTVRGNHDRWVAESAPARGDVASVEHARAALDDARRARLGALPPRLALAEGVLLVHGTPASDTEYLLEEKVDGRLALARPATLAERLAGEPAALVLCGHSHHQHAALAPGGRLVANPGAVGAPRYAGDAEPLAVEAGSPHARYAVATRRGGRWSVEMIALDYDWAPVVARARANGREDWVRGFLAGVGAPG